MHKTVDAPSAALAGRLHHKELHRELRRIDRLERHHLRRCGPPHLALQITLDPQLPQLLGGGLTGRGLRVNLDAELQPARRQRREERVAEVELDQEAAQLASQLGAVRATRAQRES